MSIRKSHRCAVVRASRDVGRMARGTASRREVGYSAEVRAFRGGGGRRRQAERKRPAGLTLTGTATRSPAAKGGAARWKDDTGVAPEISNGANRNWFRRGTTVDILDAPE